MSDSSRNWSLYPYEPVKALPIVFAIIIFLLGLVHAYNSLTRPRWPHYGWIMLWASTIWIAGFVVRAISIWTPTMRQNIPLYITQTVLILIGPPLFGASESFILGRLLAYLPYHSPIHPGRVLSTFLLLSVAIETLTASGAAMSASPDATPSSKKTGADLVNAALIVQSLVEAGFFSLVALVAHRARRGGHLVPKIRTLCLILFITSAMMFVRCVFRVVQGFETSSCLGDQGDEANQLYCGTIETHEWFMWVFEVANITIFVAILAAFPPRKFLHNNHKVFMDPHNPRIDRVGPGFSQGGGRSFVATILDPFNFAGIVSGRGQQTDPFWERSYPSTEEVAKHVEEIALVSGKA